MAKSKIIGYITLWRIPELDVRYEALTQLAEETGFSEKFIPTPPKKRGAWEKATNLGAGVKVEAPYYLSEQIERQYGAKPTVKLHTEVISRSAPRLIRHIVRTVTIPTTKTGGDKRQLAETQLDSRTVCIMEFDTETEAAISTGYNELHDEAGYINGNLETLVQDLHDQVDRAMNRAGGDDIRVAVREFLNFNRATLMSSGGAYFVPEGDGASEALQTLKTWVESLTEYTVKRNSDGSPADRPTITIIPLSETGDAFFARLDVAESAVDQFKGQLTRLMEELTPVIGGEKTETVSGKVRARVAGEFSDMMTTIAKYKVLLNDNLTGLNDIISQAQSALDTANGTNQYRAVKSKRRILQDPEIQPESMSLDRAQRGLESAEVEAFQGDRKKRSL